MVLSNHAHNKRDVLCSKEKTAPERIPVLYGVTLTQALPFIQQVLGQPMHPDSSRG